jgi:hypothetical protein
MAKMVHATTISTPSAMRSILLLVVPHPIPPVTAFAADAKAHAAEDHAKVIVNKRDTCVGRSIHSRFFTKVAAATSNAAVASVEFSPPAFVTMCAFTSAVTPSPNSPTRTGGTNHHPAATAAYERTPNNRIQRAPPLAPVSPPHPTDGADWLVESGAPDQRASRAVRTVLSRVFKTYVSFVFVRFGCTRHEWNGTRRTVNVLVVPRCIL